MTTYLIQQRYNVALEPRQALGSDSPGNQFATLFPGTQKAPVCSWHLSIVSFAFGDVCWSEFFGADVAAPTCHEQVARAVEHQATLLLERLGRDEPQFAPVMASQMASASAPCLVNVAARAAARCRCYGAAERNGKSCRPPLIGWISGTYV